MSDVFTDDDLANAEDRMRQSASSMRREPMTTPVPASNDICGWDTRRGDGPIGGPCRLPPLHDGPHDPSVPAPNGIFDPDTAHDDVAEEAERHAALSVPASNVSEGLRDVLSRHFVTRGLSEAHWRAIESDLAALAHAAPEGLDALVNAAHAVYLRLATGGTPTWDEYNALNAALHPFVLSQPDATEEAERLDAETDREFRRARAIRATEEAGR